MPSDPESRCVKCLYAFIVSSVLLAKISVAVEPCRIQIRDADCDWPVPAVELRTTHNVRFVSDNNGLIAFDLPELMGVETWFHVIGHGYGVKQDGFGYAGVRLRPEPGQTVTVKVQRQLAARRLGRITGGGLFAESQKLGLETDWSEQGILGCDSVQTIVHQGRIFWAWGDTVLPGYPLGLFHMLGATTRLKPLDNVSPPIQLRYDYFRDAQGKPRNIAQMPGDGPTWLNGLVSLPDRNGRMFLGATYSKIRPPLEVYELGLCVWDESSETFQPHKVIWHQSKLTPHPPVVPHGHPVRWTDLEGRAWMLFGDPFPTLRCPATFEAWSDAATWEVLNAQPSVRARTTGENVQPHRGSIAWNAFRNRWVTVFTQQHGKPSGLGELWYAEAEAPTGPWKEAVKVVTHDNYTFYNPRIHPEFTTPESPVLLFEATFTHTFSGNPTPVPRHDYNQMLYRLDLDSMPDREKP